MINTDPEEAIKEDIIKIIETDPKNKSRHSDCNTILEQVYK